MERKIQIGLLLLGLVALGVWLIPRRFQKDTNTPPTTEPTCVQTEQPTENKEISLPYELEEMGLVVETLFSYEGNYIEDGSDEPVSDVTGAVVCNTSDRGISFAVFAVKQGDSTAYFTVTWLPPGQRVMVLAMERTPYTVAKITDCRLLGIRWEQFDSLPITVQLAENNGLVVTNTSTQRLKGGHLRYKWYMEEYGLYFGGITHCVLLPVLEAGEQYLLYPENYGPDTAQIVAGTK
jgi:hypothetical protein